MKTFKLYLTLKDKINHIVFQNKSQDQLIEETLTSLSKLLGNIFTGDDVRQLKKDFPPGIKLKEVGIQLNNVSLHIESKNYFTPSIEISIDLINEKLSNEIGTYSIVYNEDGEQIDEILKIN